MTETQKETEPQTATGRRPRHTLSAQTVKHARGNGHVRRLADGGGLYLLISPAGTKSWVLRTVVKGRRCDIGLGGVDVVTLAEAREKAAHHRRIARGGGDPLAERRRERQVVPTFEEAAAQVHRAAAATFRNPKHRKQWLASLTAVCATFGPRRVSDLTSADVMAAIGPTWAATPETGRRVLQRVKHVFEWCKVHGFLTGDNPAAGLTKALPKHRPSKAHHAALPYAELPLFIQTLRASNAGELVRLAFEFTILCAARTSETLNAQWPEFDLDAATWTVPAERMKAGAEHRVPLSPRCVEIVSRAATLGNGGPYVFPGRRPRRPLSNMSFIMCLRRMKRTNITPHGFRSTFRDWAAERTNAPRAVCEAALAHTLRDRTEAAYHRTDLFEKRRELMNMWSVFATQVPGKVIALHGNEAVGA